MPFNGALDQGSVHWSSRSRASRPSNGWDSGAGAPGYGVDVAWIEANNAAQAPSLGVSCLLCPEYHVPIAAMTLRKTDGPC